MSDRLDPEPALCFVLPGLAPTCLQKYQHIGESFQD